MTSTTTVAGSGPERAAAVSTGAGRALAAPGEGTARSAAHPPETLEGWYAVHQVFRIARGALRSVPAEARRAIGERAVRVLQRLARGADASQVAGGAATGSAHDGVARVAGEAGWTIVAALTGSVADVMVVHFRPTLDEVGAAQRQLAAEPLFDHLEPVTSFLSVTEAGLYHITAAVAAARLAAGGSVGDAEYEAALAERSAAERASPHVQRRLYPPVPPDMPYICFYPMSKRRALGQNWYALTLEERSRLMQTHGQTGRRYAGRVQQVITGAIGLDTWEWGVTLFAGDPLDFKRLVTDMRFDEVSAQYAEFGAFYVGRILTPASWVAGIVG